MKFLFTTYNSSELRSDNLIRASPRHMLMEGEDCSPTAAEFVTTWPRYALRISSLILYGKTERRSAEIRKVC